MCVCVSVCVCERVCTCLIDAGEKGRGKGRGVQMLEFDGQSTLTGSVTIISSPSTIPPPNHHPHLPSSRRRTVAGVRFRALSGDTALSNFNQKPKKRAPAYRSSVNSPDGGKPFELSRQWWCWRLAFFFFLSATFLKKKRKMIFKKAESKTKKAEFRRKAED